MLEKKIAIIDDDPFVIAHLGKVLHTRLADVQVAGFAEPVAPAGYDVYVVDNEFEDDARGEDVIQRIRAISPQSLVVAYSGHLDQEFLRALLRQGCKGAFDKSSLAELEDMLDMIEVHLGARYTGQDQIRGIGNTVRAITGLIREWNTRLLSNGRVDAKTFHDV